MKEDSLLTSVVEGSPCLGVGEPFAGAIGGGMGGGVSTATVRGTGELCPLLRQILARRW
jgi:hypothetical protein